MEVKFNAFSEYVEIIGILIILGAKDSSLEECLNMLNEHTLNSVNTVKKAKFFF